MKKKSSIYLITGLVIVGVGLVFILLNGSVSTLPDSGRKTQYIEPYIGSMHPHIVKEGSGDCDVCRMALSRLEGHKPGMPILPLSNIYTSTDNPMFVHEGPGKDPKSGSELTPIAQSPIYDAPEVHDHVHEDAKEEHKLQKAIQRRLQVRLKSKKT